MMPSNRKSSFSTLSMLVVLGMFSLASQAQLPAKRMSRFGRGTVGRSTAFAPTANNPRASAKQTGVNLSFELVDFPRSPDSTALGLNNRGDIVGFYGPDVPLYEGTEQSYLLEGNNFQELIYPGASYTGALGINKSRKIVGWYTNPGDNLHAFLRKGKTYANIDYPNSDNNTASNINDAGIIIGIWFNNADDTVHGFVLTKGGYTTIDVPNALYTEPIAARA